jgi:hypothetical protein
MSLGDLPLLVDHIGDPFRVLVLRRIGRTIRNPDLAVRVAQQREREVVLFGELRIGSDVIETDAEDRGVLRLVLRGEVPEPGTLGRSAGRIGLRIKPEHHLAPAQIVQRNLAAAVIAHLARIYWKRGNEVVINGVTDAVDTADKALGLYQPPQLPARHRQHREIDRLRGFEVGH